MTLPEYSTFCHDLNNLEQDFSFVSTAFNPDTRFPYPYTDIPPGSILQTSDQALFHVHRDRLETRSRTAFGGLFTDKSAVWINGSAVVLLVSEDSTTINCLLHILYGMSSRPYCPDFQTIAQTFDALSKYGCRLSECIPQHSEIFVDLVSHAADPDTDSLRVYTLAACHDFEELAVPCSYYALRVPITCIDRESSIAMGPLYLIRLLRLHETRKAALSELLLELPEVHEDTRTCDSRMRMGVICAYHLIAGYLTWEATADPNLEWINNSFERVAQNVGCNHCKHNVRARVTSILGAWNNVCKTI